MIERNQPGNPTEIKVPAPLRILQTGTSSDDANDSCYMSEEITLQYFRSFCEGVVDMYRGTYLSRCPTESKLDNI